MKHFKNVKVYAEGKGIISADLIYDTRIERIAEPYATVSCVDPLETAELPSDCLVVPAFIDEHIHGANGSDVMDGTKDALVNISNALGKEGTARFLATTMTASEPDTLAALNNVKCYMSGSGISGAALLGVHLEGPFISVARAGAQPTRHIRPPDSALFDKYNGACGGNIKMLTVAPETACAERLIAHAAERGASCSIGHTDCGYADIETAIAAGARCVTHTFNAMSAFTHREAGAVGGALFCDELYCELIADGVHVSLPAVKLLIKNKPKDKLVLITDAMRAKGTADGASELGGQTVLVKNGEARLKDGTLAGSVLKMNEAVKFLVRNAGMEIVDAVDCASLNPAKNLGIDGDYGSIKVGKAADFTVITHDFDVVMTVRDGRVIYRR